MTYFSNRISNLTCTIKGHDMISHEIINDKIKVMCCRRCAVKVTSTIYGDIVPLNGINIKINNALKQLEYKRKRKTQVV